MDTHKMINHLLRQDLISKGVKFTRAKARNSSNGNKQTVDGQWLTGPDGTYIFAFMKDGYGPGIQGALMNAIRTAISYPDLIGTFMEANDVPLNGMNYFTSPEMLGKAIRSLSFGLVSYKDQTFVSAGEATKVTLEYFGQILADLKGDTQSIKDYLMNGMVKFQDVSTTEGTESSAQILCLVSVAFQFDDFAVLQYVMIGNHAYQETRIEVVNTLCTSTVQKHWNAKFQCGKYVKNADSAYSYPKSVRDYLSYKLLEAEVAKAS